jgi:hypothetical protein
MVLTQFSVVRYRTVDYAKGGNVFMLMLHDDKEVTFNVWSESQSVKWSMEYVMSNE